jgi:crotonobetainyl-CoA:carnitine CoA-transferase CaiB-like acyl-CoA transferase
VVVGVVRTIPDAVRQPQVQARDLLARVVDPLLGEIEVINAAPKYTHAQARVRGPAPRLGEHNGQVLREVLGWDDARIDALVAAGVLRSGTD